jgi:hypothetical protein
VCASSRKDDEHKLFPAGRGFNPFFIEEMVCLVSANGVCEPYCIVFVGLLLRKDARKSVVEVFLFANGHCTIRKIGRAKDERKRRGNAAMKKARSCDLAF